MNDSSFKSNEAPRGVTVQLSRPWVEQAGPEKVRRYVQVVAEVAAGHAGHTRPELSDELSGRFAEADLSLDSTVVDNLADQISRAAGQVSVVNWDGEVLHGDPHAGPQHHEPVVHGTEDPAHPDRPAMS